MEVGKKEQERSKDRINIYDIDNIFFYILFLISYDDEI